MDDLKHEMKMQRAWRSFERAADKIGAQDLLPSVLRDDVEALVFYEKPARDRAARAVLLRMREEAQRAGTNGN